MAPLPVIADTYRTALTWTDATGQSAVNVMHFRWLLGTNDTDGLMTFLNGAVTANMWLPVCSDSVVTDVAITPLDGISATQHYAPTTPAHWTGGNPADFSPATAVIVKLTTPLRGRSHRGRVFLPLISENIISDGRLNSTTAANVTTAWEAFRTHSPVSGEQFGLVIASYKLASGELVGNVLCETVLATQRRRQGRLRGA